VCYSVASRMGRESRIGGKYYTNPDKHKDQLYCWGQQIQTFELETAERQSLDRSTGDDSERLGREVWEKEFL
jgi:hypothetical protein